ncbi:helix-turn-helix transcriptional regulator [Nocardiopsis sp. CT-R113]|uniref:Helix-turn-helix transcriptional regulator n=1 Tax=Nocardiopsis codii TaxID=3065942 RepID=A0ABU7KA11_9ACTN|nr:helix-turn-helix transcriptional regulator [Nocardiopsis sp. CT-R113]MEE2039079.1 helix-turn-helix transcriptional regulator [Nocardiopsis sp. CT-R113]
MRNTHVDEVDGIDRPVLALGTDYPTGHVLEAHRHRRVQFLYGATGVMRVETADGSWTVPPHRAVLIPAGTEHRVTMTGVSTRSLYAEPEAVPWFPRRCQVVDVSPLLRALLLAAVDMPPRYDPHGRDGALVALLLHEIRGLVPLPLDLPLPGHAGLRALCEGFAAAPGVHEPPARWAERLHVSERTLHRMFLAETGMGFARWRQRACVLHALPLLARGEPVARVASDLGYASPAAFATMFSRVLGAPPRDFRSASG